MTAPNIDDTLITLPDLACDRSRIDGPPAHFSCAKRSRYRPENQRGRDAHCPKPGRRLLCGAMQDFEKLGLFYLGRRYDAAARRPLDSLLLYPSKNLTTHAVCIGMTGRGKTGLCISLLEEAAIDGIPVVVIDPKGDLANLLLNVSRDLRPASALEAVGREPARRRPPADGRSAGQTGWPSRGRTARASRGCQTPPSSPSTRRAVDGRHCRCRSCARSRRRPPAIARRRRALRERVRPRRRACWRWRASTPIRCRAASTSCSSTLLERAWRAGQDLDLAGAHPADAERRRSTRVGVLDLESFFPAKERFALALALNNLLASPGFAAWTRGRAARRRSACSTRRGQAAGRDPLDRAPRRRRSACSSSSLLLKQVLGWMRAQPGTIEPARDPLHGRGLRLLPAGGESAVEAAAADAAQAGARVRARRACWRRRIRSTSTTRGWRTPAPGSSGGCRPSATRRACSTGSRAPPRARASRSTARRWSATLAGLGNRVFLMNNVHEDAPVVFQTRWTLSYLRGPMSREEVRRLMADRRRAEPAAAAPTPTATAPGDGGERPILPASIRQHFAPVSGGGAPVYSPYLLAQATVRFFDAKLGVDRRVDGAMVVPFADGAIPLDWAAADELTLRLDQLADAPEAGARFVAPPADAAQPKSYTRWTKELTAWLQSHQQMTLWRSPSTGETSQPGEREGDFRARLATSRAKIATATSPSCAPATRPRWRRSRSASGAPRRPPSAKPTRRARRSSTPRSPSVRASSARCWAAAARGRSWRARAVPVAPSSRRAMSPRARDGGGAAGPAPAAPVPARRRRRRAGRRARSQTELLDEVIVRPKKSDVDVKYVALLWKARS